MVWCVVHFTLDDTVEVVPGPWFRKEGNCAWPKTLNIKDIKKAIVLKKRPNKQDFSFYEARCLASNIDNFQMAQKKCNLAKCKSDLSSMEDDKLKKKRKIKKIQYKTHSSSESDSEKSDTDMHKNSLPCYHSDDSEPQLQKNNHQIQNKKLNSIESRPNGWSPLKNSIIDTAAVKIPLSNIHSEKETIIMSNTSSNSVSNSPLKRSNEKISLFSEKKSPYNQRSSPSNRIKRCLFSDIDKHSHLNSNSADKGSSKVLSVKSSEKESFSTDIYEHCHSNSNSPDLNNDSSEVLPIKSSGKISLYTDNDEHNHSNSITLNLKDTPKVSVKKISNTKSSTIFKKDDQFKDMVLHSLIILKHSIRNLDEKLDLLIEKSSKRSTEDSNLNDDDIIDYTNLYCLFPIEDISTLNDIEEQLVSDKKYHKSLTNKLIGLGGKTVQIYIKRVMQHLFSDELLKLYSFNGRGNKKKCFSNLVISKLIFGSIKLLNKFNYDNANDDAEKYIKNALIQAPFNIKKKISNTETAND